MRSFRTNIVIEKMIKEIRKKVPYRFDNDSQLMRAAIIILHRELVKDGKTKRIKHK